MSNRRRSIAVVGAGPIGLEAALQAVQAGFDVTVYERGRIAENVLRWCHVRLFSPFGLNSSELGRRAVADSIGEENLPHPETMQSGRQFAATYLLPLSRVADLEGRICENVAVEKIGRRRTWKGDLIGHPERGSDRFQLLLRDGAGEFLVEADYLLDCSGTYPNHNWIGAGGMPCPGERTVLPSSNYELPDILGRDRRQFADRRTVIVGGGYSAATAAVVLAHLAESHPGTQAVWLTRSQQSAPLPRIENDSLPERDRLAQAANSLALNDNGPVHWRPGCVVRRLAESSHNEQYTLTVEETATSRCEELLADRIIANVGYRPDRQLYEELQVHECYATGGPMKLAAQLLGETSADCLAQGSYGPEALRNPEPDFFILGSKSYGRDSRFLIKTGLQQIHDVLSILNEMD